MRSAPTLKIWITPFSSVAMLEKLALLRIAFCSAPVLSKAFWRRTSAARPLALPARVGPFAVFDMVVSVESVQRPKGGLRLSGRQQKVAASTVGNAASDEARG